MRPPVTSFGQCLAKTANPQCLNYFLVYLKVGTLNSCLASIVLAFKLLSAHLYLRKKRIYVELFLLILPDQGRAIVDSCVSFSYNTAISNKKDNF